MRLIIVLLCVIATHAFGQSKEFGWMIGSWQEEGKPSYEVWTEKNGILTAESYKMKDGKKVTTEELKLIKKGNDFFYVSDVAGPQGPIEFRITSLGKNNFSAENLAHDFPKKISYKKVDNVHLKATVGDASKTIGYSFIKIK